MQLKEQSVSGNCNRKLFKKEKRNLTIILVFFELSYLLRFMWDSFIR